MEEESFLNPRELQLVTGYSKPKEELGRKNLPQPTEATSKIVNGQRVWTPQRSVI